jgi:hypothetical protein
MAVRHENRGDLAGVGPGRKRGPGEDVASATWSRMSVSSTLPIRVARATRARSQIDTVQEPFESVGRSH